MRNEGQVMKSDRILLFGIVAFAQVPAFAQLTPDEDFAERCSTAGVVSCFGFDNETTDVVRGVNLYADGLGTYRAGVDTTTKASGAGSLRFELPPPPHAGANIGGSWVPAGGWGQNFSENSTFYVQYQMRLSPYMVESGAFDGYTWKTTIFHSGSRTCGAIELTTSNYYGSPMAQMNTSCGGRGMWTTLDGSTYTATPPLLLQQSDDPMCEYGSNYATDCENYVANEWMTLYYRVHIGTWNQPNSSIDAWLGRQGASTLRQFVKVRNFPLDCNGSDCTIAPDRDDGYNNVTITPYMTGLPGTVGPSTTAYMWFDEFIVSTQPIPVPNVIRPREPGGFGTQ